METESLVTYATLRLRAGLTKLELTEELLAIGWSEEEVEAAYRGAVVALGAPLPSADNRPALARKAGAVDVVINFFSFILLGIVATALGTLYFQIINHFFPDALDAANWYALGARSDAIHYATAALIIGYPLYYFALRIWFRKFREDEGRVESKLSKWLTYLVLLVTAVTVVGDLIAVVYTLLQGEITARFLLKALVILGIAGGIFGFYYFERRKIQYRAALPQALFQRFGLGVSSAVAVGIVLGFFASGSPLTERDRSLDDTRASHLMSLASCIEQYALGYNTLPLSLDEFRKSSEYNYCLAYLLDPETGVQYDYRVIQSARSEAAVLIGEYELCATFARESVSTRPQDGYGYGAQGVWYEHEAGRSCDVVKAKLGSPVVPTPFSAPTPPVTRVESSGM